MASTAGTCCNSGVIVDIDISVRNWLSAAVVWPVIGHDEDDTSKKRDRVAFHKEAQPCR
jgi:hypothetical protein